jgi:hypothetical protein
MRFGFNAARGIGAILACGAVAAACSAGGGGKNGPGGTGSGASGSTGGSPVIGSVSGTGPNINGGGSAGSDGNPVLVDCSKTSDCDEASVCVLTPDGGKCSPHGGPCTAGGNECVNDTYCCLPIDGCMIEGVTEPTCVSNATHPVNEMCKSSATVGLFSPDLQCEWTKPEVGDPYPTSIHVLSTPLVANLPTESGTAGEIVIVTSDGGADATLGGRIRILNGQTCQQIEVISAACRCATPPPPPLPTWTATASWRSSRA